jgi:hypothetical protein
LRIRWKFRGGIAPGSCSTMLRNTQIGSPNSAFGRRCSGSTSMTSGMPIPIR